MASETQYPAQGRIIQVMDDAVVFAVAGSTYQLHLKTASRYDGPVDEPIQAVIRAKARKIWTTQAGGNFLKPVVGHLRWLQGRVLAVHEHEITIYAATPIIITLPDDTMAINLSHGPIEPGGRVNLFCFPGATFELIGRLTAAALAK